MLHMSHAHPNPVAVHPDVHLELDNVVTRTQVHAAAKSITRSVPIPPACLFGIFFGERMRYSESLL
jgi:hypothetical protein